MRLGSLNRQITLQRPASIDPTTGPVWEDAAVVWAAFRPSTGAEYREGSVAVGEERATFTIHYREDIDQTWRLLFRGRVWQVASILPVGMNEAVDLNAYTTGEVS